MKLTGVFRARDLGFDIVMLPAARIYHSVSASIGGLGSPLNTYFMTRNSLLFAELHCSVRQRIRFVINILISARNLTGRRGFFNRSLGMLSGEPLLRAFWAGVRDYVLREFGDCPDNIRRL